MITEMDLREAIAECEGQKNPNANTCIKLASYYTILDHKIDRNTQPVEKEEIGGYSYRNEFNSGTEFSDVISGMNTNSVLEVIDELMSTLMIINPRLYRSVIRKLNSASSI